uniref:Uncharacterized protein n=1 Tax=Knipowitschia caucasica TaxID=637954 RepID=A0AAV2M1D8_KNICA
MHQYSIPVKTGSGSGGFLIDLSCAQAKLSCVRVHVCVTRSRCWSCGHEPDPVPSLKWRLKWRLEKPNAITPRTAAIPCVWPTQRHHRAARACVRPAPAECCAAVMYASFEGYC